MNIQKNVFRDQNYIDTAGTYLGAEVNLEGCINQWKVLVLWYFLTIS